MLKDKEIYKTMCLPEDTPHHKGLSEDMSMGYTAKSIPIRVITISGQEAKEKYREQSLLRLIDRG